MASKPNKTGIRHKRMILDPRTILFKQYYIDPNAHTFCNAYQSAKKAGYSEQYSLNITAQRPAWFQELLDDSNVLRAEMLKNSEKNLSSVVEETKPEDIQNKKIWLQASTFVSERLGKDHYSTRKELTDKGGKRLFNNTHTKDSQGAVSDLFINVDADTGA